MTTPTYKFINKLQNKRVLIFGGTSGIGYAVAEACIEYGATVIISGSSPAKLENTVRRLTTSYPNTPPSQIIIYACDLSDEASLDVNIETLLKTVTNEGTSKLNHVVFTAGDSLSRPSLADITPEIFYKIQTVRRLATVIVAKHLLKYQEISPDSSYTLTSGMNTTKPSPGWSLVAMGGGSTEGLTRGLAVDMAPVRVNNVSPGSIDTELLGTMPKEMMSKFAGRTLVKRLGRPEDTAEAYLYIMKDGFITGSQIDTNGGSLIAPSQ